LKNIIANVYFLWDLRLILSSMPSESEFKHLGCAKKRSVLSFYVVEVSGIRVHVWKMKGWEWLCNC